MSTKTNKSLLKLVDLIKLQRSQFIFLCESLQMKDLNFVVSIQCKMSFDVLHDKYSMIHLSAFNRKKLKDKNAGGTISSNDIKITAIPILIKNE